MTSVKTTMECLADANGQYCLTTNSWTTGQCCDFNDFTSPDACTLQPQTEFSAFCARGSSITNKFLREFLIPADAKYCPGAEKQKQVIDSTYTGDNYLMQEHAFKIEVPTNAAASWHCKYQVSSSDDLASASTGYTYLEAEQYGFDDNVLVIVQPRGKYYPFNFRS